MSNEVKPNDVGIRNRASFLLRSGVLLAALFVAVGGGIYLVRHGGEQADWSVFRGERGDLRSVSGILWNVQMVHGRGLIQLGLLLLIATPVAQVAMSVLGFARQRDRMYVVIGLIVLTFLIYLLDGHA